MTRKGTLCKGARVRVDGVDYVVVELDGLGIVLRSETGELVARSVAEVVSSPLEVLGQDADTEAAVAPNLIDMLPANVRRQAEERLAEINEVFSGYRSGDPSRPVEGEPRPKYDPECRTLEERIRAKVREKNRRGEDGWSRASITRKRALYERLGLLGLVDQRTRRSIRPFPTVDRRVLEAIEVVRRDNVAGARVTKNELFRRAGNYLDDTYGPGVVALPSQATLYRLADHLLSSWSAFGPTKRKRSIANRPEPPFGHFTTTRPGEFVVIDVSPFDVFAVDPVSFQWFAFELLVAIDLYTRRIVAWDFTPRSTKGVDASLLFYDILSPRRVRNGNAVPVHRYGGVPANLIISRETYEISGPVSPGIILPDTVVVDRGSIFISQAFQDAASRLEVSIQDGRPWTPTDRPHVERLFGSIRTMFAQKLPGYKGEDVSSRGVDPEAEAIVFIHEFDEWFGEWVEGVYHVRHHEGLALPEYPDLHLSPNDMHDEGVRRWGQVEIPVSPTLYFDLLPTAWRQIRPAGVQIDLLYDDDVLNEFREERSPYNGRHRGKWPFRVDPRDRSVIYFQHPYKGSWHDLKRCNALEPDRPFSDLTVAYVKKEVAARGGNPNNQTELSEALNDLVRRWEAGLIGRKEERRVAAERMRQRQVERDRPSLALDEEPDPDDDRELVADLFEFSERAPMGTLDDAKPDFAGPAVWDLDAEEEEER